MIPENLSPQKKFIIIIMVLILATCLMALFILFYVLPLLQKGADQILEMKNELALLETKRHQIKRVEELIEESSTDLGRVKNLAVDHSNPLDFFEFLYSAASSSKAFIDVRLTESKGPSSPRILEYGAGVNINVDGSGKGIFIFLNLLEMAPYEMEIQDIIITGGGTKDSPYKAGMKVNALSR